VPVKYKLELVNTVREIWC